MKEEPIGGNPYNGTQSREYLDRNPIQPDLLPKELNLLRWKLSQKAKQERRFRFYTLYAHIHRTDVLQAAWKLVGRYKKASGVDGVTREEVERQPGGVEAFIQGIQEELKERRYRAQPVKRQHLKDGLTEIYDADLKGYFDSIPHDKLMACVKMRITDRSVLELMGMWLAAPIVEEKEGKKMPPTKNDKGTPQGGVMTPPTQ